MKKNWMLFFVVCGITYVWLFYSQFQGRKDIEAWQQKKEAYDAYVLQQQEAEKDAQLKALEAWTSKSDDAVTTTSVTGEVDAAVPPRPGISNTPGSMSEPPVPQVSVLSDEIPSEEIITSLYEVKISALGARPISWKMTSSEYVKNISEEEVTEEVDVQLIPQTGDPLLRSYPLQFNGETARDFNKVFFDVERLDDDNQVTLIYTSVPVRGMIMQKEFLFRKDSYVVDLTVTLVNGQDTGKNLGRKGTKGFGLGWQGGFTEPHSGDRVHGMTYSVLASNDDLETYRLSRNSETEEFRGPIDWAGQERKFFAVAIIPSPSNPVHLVTTGFDKNNDDSAYQVKGIAPPYDVTLYHEARRIGTNETVTLNYQLYVGPKNAVAMNSEYLKLAEGVTPPSRMIFHQIPLGLGFIRWLCVVVLGLMRWLHGLVGSWGIAVILTTIAVRIVIYPLTHWAIKNQARTMIEQQKIRPEMEAINKKFKGDPTKKNKAVMQLYRDHNVNPLGMFRGCLPMLLQMPVFLALYVLFDQAVELRGQSFLWIPDLSGPDRLIYWGTPVFLLGASFNLLPLLMGVTNYIQMGVMRMPATDATQEKIQKQMATMMPIMFIFFLYNLPSGLILYWIVSNTISIGQSVLTKKIIASHMAEHNASTTGVIEAKVLN